MQSHISSSPSIEKIIVESNVEFVVIRKPRDIVISHCKYILQSEEHFLNEYYKSLTSDEERIKRSIIGISKEESKGSILLDIAESDRSLIAWEKAFPVQIIRFERLVGPLGGGNEKAQHEEISKILEIIGVVPQSVLVDRIANSVFGIGNTFRKGKVSGWKEEFNEKHKYLFKCYTGNLLQTLGYVDNDNW